MNRAFALIAIVIALHLSGCSANRGPDPWERMNRGIFAFNEGVDKKVLTPVARGWRFVTPQFLRTGLGNFFEHLNMPMVLGNDILQLKPTAVAHDLVRIVTNTVFGLGGFIDVASREGVQKNDEDFGQTLGAWGMPSGPYLVLPFLGPSNPRDTVGFAVDSFSAPESYFMPIWGSAIEIGVELINLRSAFIEEVDQNRSESLDYYVFLRNAYVQNRRKRVEDLEAVPEEAEEDLYFEDDFDYDLEEEFEEEVEEEYREEVDDGSDDDDGGEEGDDATVEEDAEG